MDTVSLTFLVLTFSINDVQFVTGDIGHSGEDGPVSSATEGSTGNPTKVSNSKGTDPIAEVAAVQERRPEGHYTYSMQAVRSRRHAASVFVRATADETDGSTGQYVRGSGSNIDARTAEQLQMANDALAADPVDGEEFGSRVTGKGYRCGAVEFSARGEVEGDDMVLKRDHRGLEGRKKLRSVAFLRSLARQL